MCLALGRPPALDHRACAGHYKHFLSRPMCSGSPVLLGVFVEM